MNYADIHTHILYGLDDGASDIDETERLIDRAYKKGTRTIFFTPHFSHGTFDTDLVNQRIMSIKPILDKFPDLCIYTGCEILYSTKCATMLDRGELPTLANSNYVLIEFIPEIYYGDTALAVQNLLTFGFTPIIAHAERYACLYKGGISRIVESGALIQLNARSVIGKNGVSVKRFCKRLLKSDLVHFIASDCHDEHDRPPELNACAAYVRKKYGEEQAKRIFCTNAELLIHNEII